VLAVDCRVPFDFFPDLYNPDLYNEDWLFFYRDAAQERLATPGSLAEQMTYDPFGCQPSRTRSRQWGCVNPSPAWIAGHIGHRLLSKEHRIREPCAVPMTRCGR
jgi:hypothetical protein